jgi:hypothetical protein
MLVGNIDKQQDLYRYIIDTLLKDCDLCYTSQEVWLPRLIDGGTPFSKTGVDFRYIYGRFSREIPPDYLFDYCNSYGLTKSETWFIWRQFKEEISPKIRRYQPIYMVKNLWSGIKDFVRAYRNFNIKLINMIFKYMLKKHEDREY